MRRRVLGGAALLRVTTSAAAAAGDSQRIEGVFTAVHRNDFVLRATRVGDQEAVTDLMRLAADGTDKSAGGSERPSHDAQRQYRQPPRRRSIDDSGAVLGIELRS